MVMQQRNINKDCKVLFGDIFIVLFLGSALGYLTTMSSPGWGNLVAIDWNGLPVGGEFDCKFLKMSIPHPMRLYIDRCIITYKTEHESSIRSWTRLALKFIGRGDLEHFLFDRF